MALLYTKGSDKTVVLAPRQGLARKINFGDTWTDVRAGFYIGAIAATGSNDSVVSETLAISGYNDRITIGLKDDSVTNPGYTGSLFIGMQDGDAGSVFAVTPNGGLGASGGAWRTVGYYGTNQVLAGSAAGGSRIGTSGVTGASAYCQFFGFRIVIANRGLSSQTVTTYFIPQNNIAGTDYSATALRTKILSYASGDWQSVGTIAWNDGAAARDIPDCFWIRPSLYLNSLRISALRIILVA